MPLWRRRTSGVVEGRVLPAILTLVVGLVVGWAATFLYSGMKSGDPDRIGSGLNQLFATSQEPQLNAIGNSGAAAVTAADPIRASFEFYTVLPDIERVIPEEDVSPSLVTKAEPVQKPAKAKNASGYYMLQVGSYNKASIAEKMKARLALKGFESAIQLINIQDQGQFYRVQVGPFTTMQRLEKANRQLGQLGFNTLRLKVSARL